MQRLGRVATLVAIAGTGLALQGCEAILTQIWLEPMARLQYGDDAYNQAACDRARNDFPFHRGAEGIDCSQYPPGGQQSSQAAPPPGAAGPGASGGTGTPSGGGSASGSGAGSRTDGSSPGSGGAMSPPSGGGAAPPPGSRPPPGDAGREAEPRFVPFVGFEFGPSFANGPSLRDDNPNSADCVTQPAGAGPCVGSLNQLSDGQHIGVVAGVRFPFGVAADFSYTHRSGFNLSGIDEGGTNFDPPVRANTYMFSASYMIPLRLTALDIQPFVTAGVGFSQNHMEPIHWFGGGTQGVLPGGDTTSFAWSLGAGARAPILFVPGLFVSGGYRYVDLGEIRKEAGRDISGAGFSASGNTGSMTGDLTAHEIFFGLIYEFDAGRILRAMH